MTKLFLIFSFITTSYIATAQITLIPDAAFEQALIDFEIDTDGEINGQVFTADIENVIELNLSTYNSIHDVTGIQDFGSLEILIVDHTELTELDVSQNLQLKILNCSTTWLTQIDLSSNVLLEELYVGNEADVAPFVEIEEIDLSNNPNIKIIQAYNNYALDIINLKNGNNTTTITIDISFFFWGPSDPEDIYNSVCIQVDDEQAAQNNEFPYSEWEINDIHTEYQFSEDCTLGKPNIKKRQDIVLYPNPAKDIVHLKIPVGIAVDNIQVLDITGRLVKDVKGANEISLSGCEPGTYIVKFSSGNIIQTEKLVVL